MFPKTSFSFIAYWFPRAQACFAVLVVCVLCDTSIAAEFRVEKDNHEQMLVFLEGPIERGDAEKFEDAVADALSRPFLNQLVFVLNSPGGSVSEAIKIGRTVRNLLATTRTSATAYRNYFDQFDQGVGEPWGGMTVADGSLSRESPNAGYCWSACTLIFASGVIRESVENVDKKNQFMVIPTIGIHRPKMPDEEYSELSPEEAQIAHASMLESMGSFLKEMGASDEFVKRTMATPSHDIDLVSVDELEKMISEVEPFFEDWIAAKCGRKTDVLTPRELSLYQRAPGQIRYADWGFGYGERNSLRTDYTGFSDMRLKKELLEINSKVFNHADLIKFCRIITVKTHQNDWLKKLRGD